MNTSWRYLIVSFAKETDLCQAFLADLPVGWKKYPEQGCWDFVIQRGPVQIGVQAKLATCMKVLVQALPYSPVDPGFGPHYRAVLIGKWSGRTPKASRRNRDEFCMLARHLRILIIRPPNLRRSTWMASHNRWLPADPSINMTHRRLSPSRQVIDWRYYRWHPSFALWVPPFEPDLPSGVPAPSRVSPFQLAALEIHSICEKKGWVCLDDVRMVLAKMRGWRKCHPSALLQRFWYATKEPAKGRQKRWKSQKEKWQRLKTPAEVWPDLWKKVTDDSARKNADGPSL